MKTTRAKALWQLDPSDFQVFPVWQYETGRSWDEPYLHPVTAIPVFTLENRIVGAKVGLNNGTKVWAILGNIRLSDSVSTQHFLTLSVERNGKWFDLARYHDVDYARRGPVQLAAFLDLSVCDVFPIRYNIAHAALGISEVTLGKIPAIPKELLSQTELINLALE